MAAAYTVAGTGSVVGRRVGTGRVRDVPPGRAWGIEKVVRDADTGAALGFFGCWAAVIDRGAVRGASAAASGRRWGCGMRPLRRGLTWFMGMGRHISCACFICCGNTGGTWEKSALPKQSVCCGRRAWRREGMGAVAGAADRRGGGLLAPESVIQRAAAFGDGAHQA